VKDALKNARCAVWIGDFDIADSDCFRSASNPTDVQPMSETVVIGKERLVELHVMRSAIVFNPDAADLWDCVVESRFKAEREASKNAILGFSIAAASTSLLDRRWR